MMRMREMVQSGPGRAMSLWACGVLLLGLTACGEGTLETGGAEDGQLSAIESDLTSSERRQRSLRIQQAAARHGLSNGLLLAGVANAETGMAHCWSEATWACQGPASSSCDGGPVIAGSGDGPCRNRQGGLGMFQFDAGTYSQTLAREGRDILTLDGNVRAGVDFTVSMVIRSRYISGVSNRQQALDWMNSVRPNGRGWDDWIKTVTHYYNGCVPGRCSVYNARIRSYTDKALSIYNEFGHDFWYGAQVPDPEPAEPLAAPTSLRPQQAAVSTGDFIPLQWQGVSGADYDVRMEYHDGVSWQDYWTWEGREGGEFNVWPQIPDSHYRWSVRACRFDGCSDWSPAAGFTYGAPAPLDQTGQDPEPEPEPQGIQSPGSVSPAGGTFTRPSVDLSWSRVQGATHYDVHLMWQRNGEWRDYHTWSGRQGTEFTIWPQVDEVSYRWRIRACDAQECSEFSDFETFYFSGL